MKTEEQLWKRANKRLRRKVAIRRFFRDIRDSIFGTKIPHAKSGQKIVYLGPVFCQNCGKHVKHNKPSQLNNMLLCSPCMKKIINKRPNVSKAKNNAAKS